MTVVPLRNSPIEQLVSEIRGHLYDAKGAETKLNKHRLAAGQKLLELRRRVEAGEAGDVTWWEYFEKADIGRSRRDAEKLMKMARSDDPEAAYEEEKQDTRERMQKTRAESDAAHVRRTLQPQPTDDREEYDIVGRALALVAKMTDVQREQFDETYMEKYHV